MTPGILLSIGCKSICFKQEIIQFNYNFNKDFIYRIFQRWKVASFWHLILQTSKSNWSTKINKNLAAVDGWSFFRGWYFVMKVDLSCRCWQVVIIQQIFLLLRNKISLQKRTNNKKWKHLVITIKRKPSIRNIFF